MRATFPRTGRVLKSLREECGLSQAELAEKIKLGPTGAQFVSNFERGLCMPPKHCLKKLAKALGLDDLDREKVFNRLRSDAEDNLRAEYRGLV